MFARFQNNINNTINYVRPWSRRVLSLVTHTYNLAMGTAYLKLLSIFIGKTNPLELRRKALEESTSPINIFPIGASFLNQHIVFINYQKNVPAQYNEQLKLIMDLPGPHSRSSYSNINYVTKSNFFLSMQGDHAKKLRDITTKLIKSENFASELEETIDNLLKVLNANTHIFDHQKLESNWIVNCLILSLFSKVMFGIPLPSKIIVMISNLHFIPPFSFEPEILKKFNPCYKDIRSQFDTCMREFVEDEIKFLKTTSAKKDNVFVALVSYKYPNLDIHHLTNEDKQKLIDDPDVRLCLSSFLGVDNLIRTLQNALSYLYANENQALRLKLRSEIENNLEYCMDLSSSKKNVFMSKNKMPLLDAFYNEVLRSSPPLDILRYTEKGIESDGLSIPPKSVIFFKFAMPNHGEKFDPKRFINGDENKFEKERFTPFGVGLRKCPAIKISGELFKSIILYFIARIESFNQNSIKFYSEPLMGKKNIKSELADDKQFIKDKLPETPILLFNPKEEEQQTNHNLIQQNSTLNFSN